MLDRLKLKDHCMNTYSSLDDKVKDAIKFLKIGIENNETTLLLLRIEEENKEELLLLLLFISIDAKTIELKSLEVTDIPVPASKNIITGTKTDAFESSSI